MLIPVAARPKARVCGLSLARIAGLNPARAMDVVECCVSSDRGLRIRLITSQEEFC